MRSSATGCKWRLRKESTIDELTGLANRRGFLMLAEQHALLAKRTGEHFVVAFIDMDRLKPINDTLGHQAGDAAIVEIAEVLARMFPRLGHPRPPRRRRVRRTPSSDR